MGRTTAAIADDIVSFQPNGGNWLGLDALIDELWRTGHADHAIDQLLSVYERCPEDDGAGVFWSILHGLEALQGYEPLRVGHGEHPEPAVPVPPPALIARCGHLTTGQDTSREPPMPGFDEAGV